MVERRQWGAIWRENGGWEGPLTVVPDQEVLGYDGNVPGLQIAGWHTRSLDASQLCLMQVPQRELMGC